MMYYRSLGLAISPRIRFLERKKKNNKQTQGETDEKSIVNAAGPSTMEDSENNSESSEESSEDKSNFLNANNDKNAFSRAFAHGN